MTILPLLIEPLSRLLDKLIPDPEQAAKAKAELANIDLEELRLAIAIDQAQTAVNQSESQNPDLFVSGWRPFIGWVCGIAFAYHFVLQPLCLFAATAQGHPIPLPEFDMDTLYTVLMGMLGLGGLRTIEKLRK
jgi:hypothetical protein